MTEENMTSSAPKKQRPVDVLRERCGGISDRLKGYLKEQGRLKQGIRKALKEGPKTVPELAAECGAEASVVLWHLMAMRRYGHVQEAGQKDSYLRYAIKEARP
jgi:hypothetical protein